jgi:type 1 glutamine amidotransferase
LQEPLLRDHLHVLLSIDVPNTPTPPRRILKVRSEDQDFPVSWLRRYGKGRVFYSSLGHGAPLYSNAPILAHFLAGIQYALGDLKADDSIRSVTSTRPATSPRNR